VFVDANVGERGADQFARAQACRVGEIEREAQPLRGGRLPPIGPLEPVGEDFWRKWASVSAEHRGRPREELDAHFQWLGERIARPGYRGCPQINIAAEYADDKHPARKGAVAHKRELRRRLAELAREMRLDDPETFALRMGTIIDGALSSGRALHAAGPAKFLQEFAQMLMPTPKRTKKANGT